MKLGLAMPAEPASRRRAFFTWFLLVTLCLLWLGPPAGCSFRRAAPPQPQMRIVETRPKIGVALAGGGARGFAHIGALRVLEQEKIPIDLVVGSSVGSLIGALYADQGRVLDAEYHALAIQPEDLFDFRALSILSGGLVKGERLEKFVETQLKSRRIEEMKVPYAAVAVDLASGRAVVFDHGPLAPAVHASCAIPGVFVPVTIDGVTYIDGGVREPIPIGTARRLGADVVIALTLPPPRPLSPPKGPIAIIHHAVSLMSAEIEALKSGEADAVIRPEVGTIDFDDFSQKRRLLEAGEEAARRALPAILEAIDRHTRRDTLPL